MPPTIESYSDPKIAEAARRLAVAITPHLAELIDVNDPNDPIARQFQPSAEELTITDRERGDPIGDEPHSPIKGIIHREPDRVLLKPVHVCPVYCRFCFRREQVGPQSEFLSAAELEAALDYIRRTPAIWEVILSGGEPLTLSPRRLRAIIKTLSAIDHVAVIRIHTRMPVADPAKITPELIDALKTPKALWVALHCNHPNEISEPVRKAIALFVNAGMPLVSQTVLLKGINDDPKTLEALFRLFLANRIKPYYLHHGDLAKGTGHFRTSIVEGQALLKKLRQNLSGLAIPTYMLDIPGGAGKVPIGPVYLSGDIVEDPRGEYHPYPSI